MDSWTQQANSNPTLCPCIQTASLVQQIYRMAPNANLDTFINVVCVDGKLCCYVTQEFLHNQLRLLCTIGGGKPTFEFDSLKIGTRSLQSGAAIALFPMDHHPHKTMILDFVKEKLAFKVSTW